MAEPLRRTGLGVPLLAVGWLCVAGSDSRCNGHGTFDANWDECACSKGYAGDTCDACAEGFAGWPDCVPMLHRRSVAGKAGKTAPSPSYGWGHLCAETAALRADPPGFIVRLGELYEARQVVAGTSLKLRGLGSGAFSSNSSFWGSDTSGNCSSSGGAGPWKVKVDLAAPDKAPKAFDKHHRVILVFSEDWPVVLPTIRFAGKIRTSYATSSDEQQERFSQDLHTAEANGLLLRRLQEAAGGSVTCMWRQTGGCTSDGSQREPTKDRLCNFEVPLGASGFCDCDGDGTKNGAEPGFGCDTAPGTCEAACRGISMDKGAVAAQTSKGPPRHSLRRLLEVLHQSFGAPLADADQKLWKAAASAFKKEAKTVTQYKKYGRKHPDLFRIGGFSDDQMIDPQLRSALQEALAVPSREEARRMLLDSGLVTQVVEGLVFSFRVFTDEFSGLLMEEIHNFYGSKLPAKRPNSMNNYGIILNEIGLEALVFALQDAVVQPLAAILLPEEGSELESHHSFTIRYRGGEDTHLDVHTDDSDITFNVNIFGDYTGAPLVFCGLNGAPDHRRFRVAYQHKLGYAVLHRGRHRHGAEDITSGERMNLVVWSYSHAYRSSSASQKVHQAEAAAPDARCVSYTHDRDFAQFREFPPGKKERFLGRGWCPPRGKEYPGFKPDVPDSQAHRRQQQGGDGQ